MARTGSDQRTCFAMRGPHAPRERIATWTTPSIESSDSGLLVSFGGTDRAESGCRKLYVLYFGPLTTKASWPQSRRSRLLDTLPSRAHQLSVIAAAPCAARSFARVEVLITVWLLFGSLSAAVATSKGRSGCGWFRYNPTDRRVVNDSSAPGTVQPGRMCYNQRSSASVIGVIYT